MRPSTASPRRPAIDRSDFPVALVSMPFMAHFRPSVQLGLLSALGRQHGFGVSTFAFDLDLAARIGPEIHHVFCDAGRSLRIGDWLFSLEAFGREGPRAAPDPDHELLDRFPDATAALLAQLGRPADYLRKLREVEIPAFLDELMAEVDWGRFAVVGFSCTFEQNTASFALARRIKAAHPHVVTLFGGANFDDEMGLELVRTIDCIDYAVVGEGDVAFPEFLAALHEGRDPADVPGVTCRRDGAVLDPRRAPLFRGLDDLPVPDHDDWFARAQRLGLPGDGFATEIPFESSRGCWWGQKHHCTFCGLNATGMTYRTRSAGRVRAELDHLAARHGVTRFSAVDNILSPGHLTDLLPDLAADGAPYELFYEVKANLTRERIALMHEAGVRCVQPGIESLSTHVLELMRKGVTALQNVNTLRWLTHHGIDVLWGVIYGFPGERPADYRGQEDVLRLLTHLRPPLGAVRVMMERFSPMFTDRDAFGARDVAPRASYSYVYPPHVDLDRVAYSFDHEFADALPEAEFAGTRRLVAAWRAAWTGLRPPTLTYRRTGSGSLSIADFRDPTAPVEFTLAEPLASTYEAVSDRPTTAAKVASRLGLDAAELEPALDGLCADGLMLREGSAFLALALPATHERSAP